MNKYRKNKKKFIIIVVVSIIIIISYAIINKYYSNYNNVKKDKTKYLVYTESKKQFDSYYQYKPYVNLKGEFGELINNDINNYIDNFNNNNICITYEYDLNGKILSLVIIVEDHSYVESAAILYFKSYNIDLDKFEIVTDDELLKYFDISYNDAIGILNNKIEDYYNSLVQEGLIVSSKCNYSCFLSTRNFNDVENKEVYFIRDGKLVIFKPYTYMSLSDDSKKKYDFEITD